MTQEQGCGSRAATSGAKGARKVSGRVWSNMRRKGVKLVPRLTTQTGKAGRPKTGDALGAF